MTQTDQIAEGEVLKVVAPEADLTQEDPTASTPQMESLLWSISQVRDAASFAAAEAGPDSGLESVWI